MPKKYTRVSMARTVHPRVRFTVYSRLFLIFCSEMDTQRDGVVARLLAIETECKALLDIIQDSELVSQLISDKLFNPFYLEQNYAVRNVLQLLLLLTTISSRLLLRLLRHCTRSQSSSLSVASTPLPRTTSTSTGCSTAVARMVSPRCGESCLPKSWRRIMKQH